MEKVQQTARSTAHWIDTYRKTCIVGAVVILTGSTIGDVIAHRHDLFAKFQQPKSSATPIATPASLETVATSAISEKDLPTTIPIFTALKTFALSLTARKVAGAVAGVVILAGCAFFLSSDDCGVMIADSYGMIGRTLAQSLGNRKTIVTIRLDTSTSSSQQRSSFI